VVVHVDEEETTQIISQRKQQDALEYFILGPTKHATVCSFPFFTLLFFSGRLAGCCAAEAMVRCNARSTCCLNFLSDEEVGTSVGYYDRYRYDV
jgi:hypothetical protein